MSGMTWHEERRQDQLTRSADPCGRTALYRFYDKGARLLYAGISNEPWRRRREHAYSQPWWPQVRHQAVTWYDTEPEARNAEMRAIKGERPEFNKAGAVKPARRLRLSHERCVTAALTVCIILWLLVLAPVFTHPAWGRYLAVQAALLTLAACTPATCLIVLAPFVAPYIRRFGAWLEDIWTRTEAA